MVLFFQKMFNYKWNLIDFKKVNKINKYVFSCFACGGGSSMGYKMNGFDVIGINEIDKKMVKVYKTNFNPKYIFEESIQIFKKRNNLPKELYKLDILDGSPPCSTFSISGNREKDWGKERKFKEGQQKQILSDLFFDFIELTQKLQPKVVIAENVKGIILGNAKGYAKQILEKFKKIGYKMQLFLLNSATMGVPQRRERVFFIGLRNDIQKGKLQLNFNEKPILFKEIKDEKGKELTPFMKRIWDKRKIKDKTFEYINEREFNKKHLHFNHSFLKDNEVCRTIPARNQNTLFSSPKYMSKTEVCLASSFPLDYNFCDFDFNYICGMSVPPLMIQRISKEILKQWLN